MVAKSIGEVFWTFWTSVGGQVWVYVWLGIEGMFIEVRKAFKVFRRFD